jgi:hypothetical protein
MAHRSFVTIVSGLPRSGTSMMMQMIEAGGIPALTDDVRKADDDNPKGYYEFEPVKKTKEDASWVLTAVGKVVKMVHLLLLDLPLDRQYRVVFMRRDLNEVIKSQNVMLDRHRKDSDTLPEEKMIGLFKSQIARVEKYMDEHPEQFKYVDVDYNAVMKDPKPHVERVNQLLGGLDQGRMLAVVDPSLYRNRLAT